MRGRDEIAAMWAMLCAATRDKGRDAWSPAGQRHPRRRAQRPRALGSALPLQRHRPAGAQPHRRAVRVSRRPDRRPSRPLRFLGLGAPGAGRARLAARLDADAAPQGARARAAANLAAFRAAELPDGLVSRSPIRRANEEAARELVLAQRRVGAGALGARCARAATAPDRQRSRRAPDRAAQRLGAPGRNLPVRAPRLAAAAAGQASDASTSGRSRASTTRTCRCAMRRCRCNGARAATRAPSSASTAC